MPGDGPRSKGTRECKCARQKDTTVEVISPSETRVEEPFGLFEDRLVFSSLRSDDHRVLLLLVKRPVAPENPLSFRFACSPCEKRAIGRWKGTI